MPTFFRAVALSKQPHHVIPCLICITAASKALKLPAGKRPVTSVVNELAYKIRDAFIILLRWTLGPRQRDTCPINNTNAGSNCILQCGMIIDRG